MSPICENRSGTRCTTSLMLAQDDVNQLDVNALLQEHIKALQAINKKNNQLGHLLDLTGLEQPGITIFTARDSISKELMGCAALKEISPTHGELKSMRTASSHLRKGVAGALVGHLVSVARERGYERLSLETGEQQDFAAATALYIQCGFVPCKPYEGYKDDVPVEGSIFMTYRLKEIMK